MTISRPQPMEAGRRSDTLRNCLRRQRGRGSQYLLYDTLRSRVEECLRQWDERYETLKTPSDIHRYAERTKQGFLASIGQFPDRTPLNAKVLQRVEEPDHVLEIVVFESLPGFPIPALVYLPSGVGPWPWIFMACGHYPDSKAADEYQRLCVLCARYGLASICIDPVSQGERAMFPRRDGTPRYWASVEHQLEGPASILMGTNLARFMIWDAIRALDYLDSRPDVLRDRIGCTGVSGGGTLTSYLMSVDGRIAAAAPGCWTTHHRQLLADMGPDDAEQQIHAQLLEGPTFADFAIMRAPRPTLYLACTRDFFGIEGTWETFRAARRIYTRLGHAEAIDLYEADAEHGFCPELRTGCVRWMLKWLCGRDQEVREEPFNPRPPEALRCFPKGQAALMPGTLTLFDLYRGMEREIAARRVDRSAARDPRRLLETVRSLVSVRPLDHIPPPRLETIGRSTTPPSVPRHVILRPHDGVPMPAWVFSPDVRTVGATILVHERGKTAAVRILGEVNTLLAQGQLVAAVDLPGTGETQRRKARRDWMRCLGPNWQESYLAYMLGTTLLGIRTEGLLTWARHLRDAAEGPFHGGIRVVATGDVGVAALHALTLEPGLFDRVELRRSLASWTSVVRSGLTRGQIANVVHGALLEYDLPDLVALVPPSKLAIHEPLDAMGRVLEPGEMAPPTPGPIPRGGKR